MEALCIGVLLIGLIGLLVSYAKATIDVFKEIGIVNPLTVSLVVILLIAIIAEILK